MDFSDRLAISFYKPVAVINEAHNVYLVQHQESHRFFVKKTLEVYSSEVYKDLQEHPIAGVPRIIDLCEEVNKLTLIEEFISGITLQEMIEKSMLTTDMIGKYMAGLCSILTKMHEHNPPLIHRDIKPSNIMITNYDVVILLDFNAARYYSGVSGRDSDTKLLGTRGYAAPEQYGFGESSPRTDIYSIGAVLKEAVESQRINDHVFDVIIKKCMQMDPSKRYSSAKQLRAAILRAVGTTSAASGSDTSDMIGAAVDAESNPFLPPGFRTHKLPNMLVAFAVYVFVFYICLTLKVNETVGAELWMERIGVLIIALFDILLLNNYCNLQRFAPFQRSDNLLLRELGIFLMAGAITIVLFFGLVFIVGMLFHGGR